ncbi:MAG: hypothetical protein KG003_02465 [Bacteroidetes bacterium]|nr:hypothetical protein [Bacteroidota bacterium]
MVIKYFSIILISIHSVLAFSQIDFIVSGNTGIYLKKNNYDLRNPISAVTNTGLEVRIFGNHNRYNLFGLCTRNQTTVKYELPSFSYFRKEETYLYNLGCRLNLIKNGIHHPFIALSAGFIDVRVHNYSDKLEMDQNLPSKFFHITERMAGLTIGYTLEYRKCDFETFYQYNIFKPNHYSFLLKEIVGIKIGYNFNNAPK